MATPTYTLIDSEVLASAAASVTFSSIPADYRDLVLVADGGNSTASNRALRIRFNSDTGTNYNWVQMNGNGTTAGSSASTSQTYIWFGLLGIAPAKALSTIHVMDYSATDKHKSALSRGSNAADSVYAFASRWASTDAVTSIEVFSSSGDLSSGSTFYLYGIES
jgi:hypothetical protein